MIQDQIRYAPSFMFPIVTFALTIDEYLVKPLLLSEGVWDPSGIAEGQYLGSKVDSERHLIWVKERRPVAHAARQRPDRPLGDRVPRVGRRTDRYPIGAQT